jgi:tellurite resistance protein TerC
VTGPSGSRRAIGWVAVCVAAAAAFGLALGVTAGWLTAGQFYTGYLTEYSLSLDNLFVFSVIMTWFAVPPARQPRVLLFGVGAALVLRSAVIVAGAAALNRFGWLFYPLGAILVWTAIGLLWRPAGSGGQSERHARLATWLRSSRWQRLSRWWGRRLRPGRAGAPVLLLAAVIGLTDLLFAFDSIPAVFGITTSAWLVVACNAFALMGLRQVYVLMAGLLGRIAHLNTGLGLICAFTGVRLILRAAFGPAVIPGWIAVLVVAAVLAATILASGMAGRRGVSDGVGLGGRAMLERRFAVVDTDGNGVWHYDDGRLLTLRLCETFGHAADSVAGLAVAAAQRELFDVLLAHMDANGDSAITPDEFVAAVGTAIVDRPAFDAAAGAAARSLILVADTDGNGVLDAAEYTRLAAVCGTTAASARRAFGRIDRDRNGTLDAAELGGAISLFFTSRAPLGRAAGTTVRSV